ncbi:MAG: transcriptional repressor [Ruminococcaceae bacterium]|nr:transcriptional repressor [Oscillospiraceae bacterium]
MVQRRFSKQRQIIYDMIVSNPVHPTADYIYNALKGEYPDLSLGTVYRNLNVLTEMGMIIKITSEANSEHYDGNTDCHYHLMCEKCHGIFDVDIPYFKELEKKAQERSPHKIKTHTLVFSGVCDKCGE